MADGRPGEGRFSEDAVLSVSSDGGDVRVFELYDADSLTKVPSEREFEGSPVVLRHAHVVWILHGRKPAPCVDCFLLWRLHSWSKTLSTDHVRGSGELRTLTALECALLSAQICSIRSEGRQRPAGMMCVRRVDLSDGTATDHFYLRHPGCLKCGAEAEPRNNEATFDLAVGADHARRARPLEEIRKAIFPYVLDERTGLIRKVTHRLDPSFLSAATSLLYPFRDPENVERGFGRTGRFGDDPTVSVIEALERFAGMSPRNGGLIRRGSFDDLREEAIDPEEFILHKPEQYEEPGFHLARYDPGREIDWVPAYSFRSRSLRLVPLQLAYFGIPSSQLTGGCFIYEVSNGCAAGSSLAEAALFGLAEVIERDAFMVAWHSARPLRRIDPTGCTLPMVSAMLARLRAEGLGIDVLDIGAGLPGYTLAVKIADPALRWGPYVTYATATDWQPEHALKAALQEGITSLYSRDPAEVETNVAKASELLANPYGVRSMPDHSLQCWAPDAAEKRILPEIDERPLAWDAFVSEYREGDMVVGEALENLVAGTLGHCHDILLIDQSFEPLKGQGLHFAKILAPGLLPMTFGHCYRRLDSMRLRKFTEPGRDFRSDPHVFL